MSKTRLQQIEDLAALGQSRRSISRALGASKNLFSNPKAEDAYQIGLDKLRDRIAKESIQSGDFRDRALLFNRLNILAEPLPVDEIKDIDSLERAMGRAMAAFLAGKINTETLNTFTKSAAQLAQLFFDTNVKKELDELKELLQEKGAI